MMPSETRGGGFAYCLLMKTPSPYSVVCSLARWLRLPGSRMQPLLALLLAAPLSAKERWIYIPTNFQVDESADKVIALLERGAESGYTHAFVIDSKFAHLQTVTAAYRPNVERVKAAAERLHIELVPGLFPVGYSNDLLFNNPNLAEGLPVKDAPFIVKNSIATIAPDPAVSLPGGEMNDRSGWGFIDENLTPEEGAMRSPPTDQNARLNRKLTVAPFRQYHVSVRIRSEGFSGSTAEIKAIGKDGRQLQWTSLKAPADSDWKTYDVTFNSLDSTEIDLYFGIWSGHKGTLWWDDARIEECGPSNLLLRPGAPFVMKKADGTLLKEGSDYEKPDNSTTGNTPWPGAFLPWITPPEIRVKNIPDGELLRISYSHTHIVYDEQVSACVEEPETRELLKKNAAEVSALFGAKTYMMSHDEWRVLGWDKSCMDSGKTAGEIAAENLRLCTGYIREKVPAARLLVWNDMFDPFHNATKDYYLVRDSYEGSWKGLEPGVEIMNWNFGKRAESLAFFEKLGHPQVIAGYYDDDLANVSAWLDAAKNTKGVKGFMYTTWRNDYSNLEKVAAILDKAGW